MDRYC